MCDLCIIFSLSGMVIGVILGMIAVGLWQDPMA
jgi:hypothetical protein